MFKYNLYELLPSASRGSLGEEFHGDDLPHRRSKKVTHKAVRRTAVCNGCASEPTIYTG
jgi:hypothetical protein